MRPNSHIIQFAYLKCMIDLSLVYATINKVNFRMCSSLQKKPYTLYLSPSYYPAPKQAMDKRRNQKGSKKKNLQTNKNGNTKYLNMGYSKSDSHREVIMTNAYIKKKET